MVTFGEVTVRVIVASSMVIVILVTIGSLTVGAAADAPRVKASVKTEANLDFMAICGQTQGNVCPERYEQK